MLGIIEAIRDPRIQALLVFITGYIYICSAKRFRATALWLGVLCLLLLGIYQPGPDAPGRWNGVLHLLDPEHMNWNVLMILAGAMVVADLFIISKVPVLLANLIIKHLKTVGGAALGVCAMASLLSAFIENVTTVLIVAPIAIELARRLKVSPVPFIIGLAISSNLQGTATLIGDPPSLILASELRLNFLDFIVYRGRPGIFWAVQTGAIGSMLALWMLFFRRYKGPVVPPKLARPTSWFPTWLLGAKIVGLSLVPQLPEHWLPHSELYANGAVCMAAAIVGLAWYWLRRGKRGVLNRLLKLDVQSVALLAGIFALTFALKKTGVIDQIAVWITQMVGDDLFLTFTLVVWISVLASAFIDNVPYTAVMLPAVLGIASRMEGLGPDAPLAAFTGTHTLLAFGLLIGACLGGNISPVGAAANIVGVGILRKEGNRVGFWTFVRMGLPFTIAATLPAYLFLWWLWA
ncbi:MAG: SLC13 family permease [Planctomycetota bacterium]